MTNVRRAGIAVLAALAAAPLAACDPADATFSVSQCAQVISPGYGTGCGDPLRDAIEGLAPGETLAISAGTYDVGDLRLDVAGTSTERINVRAADPQQKPLLKGWVYLRSPMYFTMSGLRFQATRPDLHAMAVWCGVGWVVEGSEFFGAAQTGSYANMYIGGRQPGPPNPDNGTECANEPRDFRVSGSVFSQPYTDPTLPNPTASYYHNLYIGFEGSGTTGGQITRNIFLGNRNGAGVKLGDGVYQSLGPRNVQVHFNTFYDGQRGIHIHDDVRGNTLLGNLIVRMRGGGGVSGERLGVAVTRSTSPTNTLSHTYAYDLYRVWGPTDTGASLSDQGDNVLRTINPDFDANWVPAATAARPYGAYGTGNFG